jgi:hypothetical protein
MNPQYPIYIISKGRASTRLTSKELERLKVPYRIVIEPQEYDEYAAVINPSKILKLPFSNLGQGSIPARNWVWDHSLSEGYKRHWILDDNIEHFHRLNMNMKPRVTSGTIFRCAEDFTDRYENVGLSGFNYYCFCYTTDRLPPYYLNTRIYSCILVDNSLPFRWRGRYNEDTDLSIRVLKFGLCTILFNAFLAGKKATLTMKGGNTDNVYTDGDNRLKFAESLREQHPDIVKVVWKFNRWHHLVDYSQFKKNKLIRKKDIVVPDCVNNYGMTLRTIGD